MSQPEAKTTAIIYHKADFDGIFSREIARRYFGDKAEYIGWDYGDPPPVIAPEVTELYMIDISVDGMMDDPRLIWIDHHKSAMEKFPATIPGYRIDGVAACRLAWQWFFTYNNRRNPLADHFAVLPEKQDFIDRKVVEPISVRLAGEYDVFDHRDERALVFQHGLKSLNLDGRWPELLSTTKPSIKEVEALVDVGHAHCMIEPDGSIPPAIVWSALKNGELLLASETAKNASVIRDFGFTVQWEGLTFLACNAARYNSFLFVAGLKPEHDAVLGFNYDGKGKWRVSLYGAPGKPDVDLAAIASKYGGGGHKQACGFKVATLPFALT